MADIETRPYTDTSVAAWRKSRFCNGASACVEVANLADGSIALRDSKEPDGPVLVFTPSEWAAFTAGVRDGEFDVAALRSAALASDGTDPARPSEPPVAASGADSVPGLGLGFRWEFLRGSQRLANRSPVRKAIKESIDQSRNRERNRTMTDRPMTVFLRDQATGQDRPYQLAPDEFPSQIGVFCDGCGTTVKRDYVISEAMSKPERLEVARASLRREGWQCDGSGDWCPACGTQAENGGNLTREEDEVRAELARQDERWGEQNHPDGTGLTGDHYGADHARKVCQQAAAGGTLAWRHILREEVNEAFAEDDPDKLLAELLQVEAVARQWRMAIRRRLASKNGGEVSAR